MLRLYLVIKITTLALLSFRADCNRTNDTAKEIGDLPQCWHDYYLNTTELASDIVLDSVFEVRKPHQVILWNSVHQDYKNLTGINVPLIKTVAENGLKNFNLTAICQTPYNPSYNSSAFLNYAFWPRGWRVSRVLHCEKDISIRLVNYQHATYSRELKNVRILCHNAMEIAWRIADAMNLDQIGFQEKGDEYSPKHRSFLTNYDHRAIWGDRHPGQKWVHDLKGEEGHPIAYTLLGRSWWGQDPSWAIHIGQEGCSTTSVAGENNWVIKSDSSLDL